MSGVSTMAAAPQAGVARGGINLLRWRGIAALVRWRGFPGVFQVLMLGIFVGLAVMGWGRYTPEGVNAKLYAKTNLVNPVIWGLWWPGIVWGTFLLGGRFGWTQRPLGGLAEVGGGPGTERSTRMQARKLMMLAPDDADLSSKSTFAMLTQAVALQSGEVSWLAPVLTLPAGK